jgi:16S rRNA (adenine1518-N6/adenine1519-N6)-dimethyltransferase
MQLPELRLLLERFHIVPSRSKGQNFLLDEDVIERMVAAAEITDKDLVVEIGPGLAVLTKALCAKAKSVLAVELDSNVATALRAEVVPARPNLTLWEGDALSSRAFHHRVEWLSLQSGVVEKPDPKSTEYKDVLKRLDLSYKVVANLPYQITSKFMRSALEVLPRPSKLVVMLQKEVAERATGKPGEMSLLSLAVQAYARAEIVEIVRSDAFYPQPEVDSAVLSCDLSRPNADYIALDEAHRAEFWRLAKAGYASRRKQLKNNLMNALPTLSEEEIIALLAKIGQKATVRAQELSVSDWSALATETKSIAPSS